MDIFDQASDRELSDTALSVKHVRDQVVPIKYTGHCLYCNETLEIGRFCKGEDCGEQWEFEQKMKGISGKR